MSTAAEVDETFTLKMHMLVGRCINEVKYCYETSCNVFIKYKFEIMDALKNFRDFLQLYNKISESCFMHCVNQLAERELTQDEGSCVDACARKFVNVNHKVMQVYMEVQPQVVSRRIEEVNKQQEAAAAAAAKKEMEDNSNNNRNKGEVTSGQELKMNAAGA